MELEKVHNHTITALESEKQVLLERIKEAENRLLEHQPNSSTELSKIVPIHNISYL